MTEAERNPTVYGISRDEAVSFFRNFAYSANHQRPRCHDRDGQLECWYVVVRGSVSTCDDNGLTRAVFDAHDRGWRMEIQAFGMNAFKISIQKRQRGTDIMRCAPTLDEALAAWRGRS